MLRRLAPALRASGYEFDDGCNTSGRRGRFLTLRQARLPESSENADPADPADQCRVNSGEFSDRQVPEETPLPTQNRTAETKQLFGTRNFIEAVRRHSQPVGAMLDRSVLSWLDRDTLLISPRSDSLIPYLKVHESILEKEASRLGGRAIRVELATKQTSPEVSE